jgi:hypothetical protein
MKPFISSKYSITIPEILAVNLLEGYGNLLHPGKNTRMNSVIPCFFKMVSQRPIRLSFLVKMAGIDIG